jgi:hypothetical protein
MLYIRPLAVLLCAGSLTYAATLDVYQDKSFYHYHPSHTFVGFAKGIQAQCADKRVRLERTLSCPDDQRLCQLSKERKDVEEKVMAVRFDRQALEALISLPQPTVYDAKAAIAAAREIGKEQAQLERQEKRYATYLDLLKQKFSRQASSDIPLALSRKCEEELTLTIPGGLITFDTNYEGEIRDNKEIRVTQSLSVSNRSGIDIEAKRASFHYSRARSYVNPLHFAPWIVSKYVPVPKRVYKKSMMRAAPIEMAMDAEAMVASPAANAVSYEDAREYRVTGLTLPSTGEPLDLQLLQWKAPLHCQLRAYPYLSTQAIEVCTFKPKYQIEKNRWKIKEGGKMINENAIGEYKNGVYELYLRSDPDIQIRRHPIVKKERETGIFGGTMRKKDGFVLEVTNKSDKSKRLKIVERIPTSTTDEIKVKLLDVKSDTKVAYRLGKEGKIEITLDLKAHAHKKIKILFELSYDKDVKVNY